MVSHNFEDRPSIDDILNHPFLWSNTKRVMYLTDVGNKIDQHKELLEDVCWSCGKYNTYMLLFFPSYDYQHLHIQKAMSRPKLSNQEFTFYRWISPHRIEDGYVPAKAVANGRPGGKLYMRT